MIWGLHRDTADIQAIGLPVFSLGAIPTGPLRLDARAHDALVAGMAHAFTLGTIFDVCALLVVVLAGLSWPRPQPGDLSLEASAPRGDRAQ